MARSASLRQTLRTLFIACTAFPQLLHAAATTPFDFVGDLLDAGRILFGGEAKYLFRPSARTIDGLTEDFGHLIATRTLAAQRPLGAGTIEVGLSATSTRLAYPELWQQAAGEAYRKVDLPRLHARVGLPWQTNLGVSWYRNPHSEAGLQGIELARQFIAEDGGLPALSLGVAVTRLSGVPGLDLRTVGTTLTVSREFGAILPYAGANHVRTSGSYSGSGALPFDMKAAFWRGFVGAEARFGMFSWAAELGGKRGASDAGMRLSVRF